MELESYGAVSLFRFVSGEPSQYFELSRAELDALMDACEQHRQRGSEGTQEPCLDTGPPCIPSDDVPF